MRAGKGRQGRSQSSRDKNVRHEEPDVMGEEGEEPMLRDPPDLSHDRNIICKGERTGRGEDSKLDGNKRKKRGRSYRRQSEIFWPKSATRIYPCRNTPPRVVELLS